MTNLLYMAETSAEWEEQQSYLKQSQEELAAYEGQATAMANAGTLRRAQDDDRVGGR